MFETLSNPHKSKDRFKLSKKSKALDKSSFISNRKVKIYFKKKKKGKNSPTFPKLQLLLNYFIRKEFIDKSF